MLSKWQSSQHHHRIQREANLTQDTSVKSHIKSSLKPHQRNNLKMQFAAATALAVIFGLTSALPSPQNFPTGANIITPTVISQYEVSTGAVHYNTPDGKIFKDGKTTDITTLLTFDMPASLQGMTCEFHFYLDTSSTLSGSEQFDVFSSLAPATTSTTTWPQGNQRDQYIGRMAAYIPGEASWESGFPQLWESFPCPYGEQLAGELVGTGDQDDIEWLSGNTAGAYIKYY
jgi:Ubiquitin 3 binding protein But2 C-terminal domain